MQPSLRGSRWAWLGPTLWWGIPLGLLQIGIILNGVTTSRVVPLDWPESIALAAFFYFIIPAIARFSTIWRHGGAAFKGSITGLRIGACSILLLVIASVALVIGVLVTPPSPRTAHPGPLVPSFPLPPAFAALILGLLLLLLIALNGVGLALASLGGLLGDWLGRRTFAHAREV